MQTLQQNIQMDVTDVTRPAFSGARFGRKQASRSASETLQS